MTTIPTPFEFVTSVADFRFPAKVDARLQKLMDRNTEGLLSASEREELEALVELSETIALLRVQALRVLDKAGHEPHRIRQAEALFGLFPPP